MQHVPLNAITMAMISDAPTTRSFVSVVFGLVEGRFWRAVAIPSLVSLPRVGAGAFATPVADTFAVLAPSVAVAWGCLAGDAAARSGTLALAFVALADTISLVAGSAGSDGRACEAGAGVMVVPGRPTKVLIVVPSVVMDGVAMATDSFRVVDGAVQG